jgi:predicted HicB family RNase H-like nuclease
LVNINIEIPEDTHKKIKILSAMQGTALKDLIVKVLEESINEKNK